MDPNAIFRELHADGAVAQLRWLQPGVLWVDVAGPVTAATRLQLRAAIAAEVGARVQIFVVDYSQASLALTLEDLVDAPGLIYGDLPYAVVCGRACAGIFTVHARWAANSLGVTRRVFISEQGGSAAAASWVMRRASVEADLRR